MMCSPFEIKTPGILPHHPLGMTHYRPYEQALALADGDEEALRNALALFERLRAQPAVTLLRQRLRKQGIGGIPRGPRLSTRTNQVGLTTRQLEVADSLPHRKRSIIMSQQYWPNWGCIRGHRPWQLPMR